MQTVGTAWHDDIVDTSAASASMIGREGDLKDLRTILDLASESKPQAVVIAGEAGIGKTRLLREFAAEAAERALVIGGQCVDLGQVATPYAPITALIRTLIDQVGVDAVLEAAGPGRETLGILLPEISGPATDWSSENRLHEVVAVLFETLAREQTLIVVIEDLHWADDATLTVVKFLLRAVSQVPLMVVMTYRSDDVHRGHPLRGFLSEVERGRRAQRITLRRLTRAQVRKQASAILGRTADFDLVESLYERSEGVPFFVEELVGLDDTCDRSLLPDTLRDLLLARYERLDEPTQYVLRVLSAGGVTVSHDLVAAVCGRSAEDFDAAARQAIQANLLIANESSYSFRHALVREAIHGDLLPGERTRFHTRYAEALEQSDSRSLTEIAYHWDAANNPHKAFPAALAAMKKSHDAYAHMAAARMGERALELWDVVDDPAGVAGMPRFRLMTLTASSLRLAGEMERSQAIVNLALGEEEAQGSDRARLLNSKALNLAQLAQLGSIPLLEEALALVPEGVDELLRAMILNRLAARFMIEARLTEAVDRATQALELAQALGLPAESSIASNLRGVTRAHAGDVDGGLKDLRNAEEFAQGNDDALLRFRVNYSDSLHLLGQYAESVKVAEEGIESARRLGVERTSGAILGANAVDPLFAVGDWPRANEMLDRIMALAPPPTFRVYLFRLKVWATLWSGDIPAAERMFRHWSGHMLELAEVEMQTRLQYLGLAADLALAGGDAARAWGHVSYIVSDFFRSLPGYDLPILALAARTIAALRADAALNKDVLDLDTEEAEKQLRRVLEADDFWPTSRSWTALFDAELGGDGGTGTSVEAWAAALEVAPSLPAHFRSYILLRHAMAQFEAGDRTAAAEGLRAAIEDAQELGAGLVVLKATEFADRAGLALSGSASKRLEANSIELTARERQVLDLVARGLTNRQIGEELFISGKTASVHVSAILRKLGASSRTEAAVLAASL